MSNAAEMMGDLDQPIEQVLASDAPETKVETPTPPAGPDFSQIAQMVGGAVKEAVAPLIPKAPEAPQMTAEEARKLLKFPEFDDEFFTKFNNLETQKDAFLSFRDRMIEHQNTVLAAALQRQEEALTARYNPIVAHLQQQEAAAQTNRLFSTYPTLADEKLEPAINWVVQQFKAEGKTFATEQELFDAVAQGVETAIKPHNAQFTVTRAEAKAKAGGIPVTSPGGGGGGGTNTKAQAPTGKSKAIALMG